MKLFVLLSLAFAGIKALAHPAQDTFLDVPASVDAKFKKHGKYFGVATDIKLLKEEKNAAIIAAAFGAVTPENSMKWDSLEPKINAFQWAWPDYLVQWAGNHSQIVRGHTFVWHSQLPDWVKNIKDKAELTTVMKRHINTAMGRYKGKIYAWDVVNEMFKDGNGELRDSVWSKTYGDGFVKIAFETARAADSKAKLYINDFNLDQLNNAKTQKMISKVKEWRAAGIPIDGIGSQAHLKPGQAAGFGAALKGLCAVVPECAITELDIEGAKAEEYATVAKACLDIKNCVGITVWGLRDPDSWRKEKTPLLFGADYKAKPAWNALLNAVQ
ncbi:structural studies On the mobility in the active site of the Thermoascus Aurantiacus xylanase I [Tothia fuscella]|uniref:Beta-xylanase n=1 Tax=Tothia fuscella TaxID=1048955 RepID=A0A9P4NLY0_9PEZI|nr:structural studies On the mobility in the active site of the Thermoascus Aurantiacus xylanase I [Tothia fuscella]